MKEVKNEALYKCARDANPLVDSSYFDFHASTECARKRNAAQEVAVFAAVYRNNVEENDQQKEQSHASKQTNAYRYIFYSPILKVEVHVWHEGEGK